MLKSRGTEETFAHANVHVVTPASCRQDAGATKCGAAAVAFQLFYFALHDFCLLALLVKRRWSLLVRLRLARMNWFLLLLGGRVFARDAASGDHSKKSCRPLWSWQRVDATGAVINRRAPAYALKEATQVMNPNRTLVRFLWTTVIFLAFIGLAVAARRSIALLKPGTLSATNNPAAGLDTHFANHRTLTLAHILPAMLFMVLGPLQFVRSLRSKYPQFHRWSGRIFLTASAVVGMTGLTMAFGKTIGGVDEKAAITLFGTFFLVALTKALWHALRREFAQHREWMIRGYAIGLAVATIRPIMATFFAAALLRGYTPEPKEFFGTAFWIGFTLQMIAAEMWINHTRPTAAAQMAMLSSEVTGGLLRTDWSKPRSELAVPRWGG